ncbi:hypothetical protein [Actinomadura litoris]|uniref:Uncharacterized protein n=1 Tax=Actinomadura litoris TaxID=2678616 RepID=A0A7K1L1B4_9ACTN|nr:hypothetical protein [Actinomadura litoris]MUN38248.1 hypothetical protein [Actinomadura litoris]
MKAPEEPATLHDALAACRQFLGEVATETQYYFQGKRENPDKMAYLGNIIERHAAREREVRRKAEGAGRSLVRRPAP